MTWLGAAAAGVAVALAAGCGGTDDSDATLRVFAAASLGDLMNDLAASFESDRATVDDITVEVNTAGSSTLRLQLDEGAAADVFAPADGEQLRLLTVPTAAEPIVFATNRLVSTHRVDEPAIGIDRYAEPDLLLGACAPSVPCGAYAAAAFAAVGVEPSLDTEEPDVRSLASKVAEGELDAGLVYATDVLTDRRLAAVELPSSVDVNAVEVVYPVVRLADADHPELAAAFVEYLFSDEARSIITDHGFGLP